MTVQLTESNVQTFTSVVGTMEKKVLTFNGDTATGLDNDNTTELVFGIDILVQIIKLVLLIRGCLLLLLLGWSTSSQTQWFKQMVQLSS